MGKHLPLPQLRPLHDISDDMDKCNAFSDQEQSSRSTAVALATYMVETKERTRVVSRDERTSALFSLSVSGFPWVSRGFPNRPTRAPKPQCKSFTVVIECPHDLVLPPPPLHSPPSHPPLSPPRPSFFHPTLINPPPDSRAYTAQPETHPSKTPSSPNPVPIPPNPLAFPPDP